MRKNITRLIGLTSLACIALACSSDDRPEVLESDNLWQGPSQDSGPDVTVEHDAAADATTDEPTIDENCAPTAPSSVPVPSLKGPNYTVTLESTTLHLYEGLVRAHAFYINQPPLIADFVVCNGDFENPKIKVGLTGHYFSYSYTDAADAPKDGYIVNVHAVPASPAVDATLRRIRHYSRVRIWGFEVLKIDYASGGWWTDAGCNTMLITHVCIDG